MKIGAGRLLMLIGLGAMVAGCGSQIPLWRVYGKVVFTDGTFPTFGVIEFTPTGGGPSARGKINSEGTFNLYTGDREGAVAGPHRIAIVQPILTDDFPGHVKHRHHAGRIHRKYARPHTSGLTREVRPGQDNEFLIEVLMERAPAR